MDAVFVKIGTSMGSAMKMLESIMDSPEVAKPIKIRKIQRRLEARLKAEEDKRRKKEAEQERRRLERQEILASLGATSRPVTFNWKKEGF